MTQQKSERIEYHQKKKTSFFSTLFLLWSFEYSKVCHQKQITQDDIREVEQTEPFEQLYKRWDSFWLESANIYADAGQTNGERVKWTLNKTFRGQIIIASLMSFVAYQASIMTPLIVFMISQSPHQTFSQSVTFFALLFMLKLFGGFFFMKSQFSLKKIGSKIFSCLCYSLSSKSLKKLNFNKRQLATSQISKLAQYDCSKLIEYPLVLAGVIFETYSIIFITASIYYIGGWNGFLTCLLLVILNVISCVLTYYFKKHQLKINSIATQRIKQSTEFIKNMKFIKVSALQNFFYQKLNTLRTKEVGLLNKFWNLGVIITVITQLSFRICIFFFIVLCLINGEPLNSSVIFTIFLSFHSMALRTVVVKINSLFDIYVSIVKIEQYLSNEQEANSHITHSYSNIAQNSIALQNGNFYWETQSKDNNELLGDIGFSLKNITFEIKRGEFVAFIGEYGSGKSSIINAILGQMKNQSSKISINGSIAYISQSPWIINDSIKNNILFGEQFSEKRYKETLFYSQLQHDLVLFADGQESIIGQKGSTLSGGQKARISLARALYKNADIYILDDILSALDAYVGAFIFQETLAKYLKGKTIILATHLVNYLHLANRVCYVENGEVKNIVLVGKNSQLNIGFLKNKAHKPDKIEINQQRRIQQMPSHLQVKNYKMENEQKSQLELFKILIKRRGGVPYIIVKTLVLIFMVFTNVIVFYWLRFWVNSQDSSNPSYIYIYLLILAAYIVSISIHAKAQFSFEFFYEIHRQMTLRIFTAPMAYFEKTSISKSINRLSNDLKKVDDKVLSTFNDTLFFLCLSIIFVFNSLIIYIGDGQILMIGIILVTIALVAYSFYYFMNTITMLHKIQQQYQIPIFSSFVEILFGAPIIRAENREEFMKSRQRTKIQKYLMTQKIMAGIQSMFAFVNSVISLIMISGFFAKVLFFNNTFDFFLVYNILSFDRSVQYLHKILSQFLITLKYLGFCEQLMSIQQEQGYDLVQKDEKTTFKDKIDSSEWIEKGMIQFQNFSVKYRPQLQTVLKDITLKISHKQKIGIVGRTGSGKSTTTLSILRIVQDHKGTIKIDGKDIYSIDIQTLRAGFSVILQDHFLFSGTIRENIDPQNRFSDLEIINCLELCELWDSIRVRNGLETVIEEGGNNFSAGEKQLINISRTLLNPKKIVLVDEATASIDYKNDERLQRIMKEMLRDSTVFTIAHRINTILESDKILVLDEGRIAQFDSPALLLKKENSIFRKLYEESKNNKSI